LVTLKCQHNLVLEHLKIGIPKGTYFLLGDHQYSNSTGDISDFLRQIKYPIILKPNDSSLGKGITILRKFNQQHIHNAISKVRQYSDVLIVQEYLLGQEYRVVAIEGEIIFALRKHESPMDPEEIPLSGSTCFIDIVRRSMKHLGATICGYDFIVENGSVKVLEINSDPFVFRIKEHLAESTLELYFLKLEQLLRRSYGN
jgi:glutathione synthase/RimK-type ligase-like ATP-grasp enzyme